MNQFPPSTWVYHYGHFEFFRKFTEIFAAHDAPPVLLTPVANGKIFKQKNINNFAWTPVVHLDLRKSPRIFEKIRNEPNVIFMGLGEGDSWKNPEAKDLVTLSL
jgi:hypothetical protein